MDTRFNCIYRYTVVLLLLNCGVAIADSTSDAACYSAFHYQVESRITNDFNQNISLTKTTVDYDIHIRRLSNDQLADVFLEKESVYIVLIKPTSFSANGQSVDMSSRYRHPVILTVDNKSGAIVSLDSTEVQKKRLNEYLSILNSFQYSMTVGEYRYRDGHGVYQSAIQPSSLYEKGVVRTHLGYGEQYAGDRKATVKVLKYAYHIDQGTQKNTCFFMQAKGEESVEIKVATASVTRSNASYQVNYDPDRALPDTHYFYQLNDDMSQWPTYPDKLKLTREQSLKRLSKLFLQLEGLLEPESRSHFIKSLSAHSAELEYLSDYLLNNTISNGLSLKLFWALNSIDTPESVGALINVISNAENGLAQSDIFRALMGLESTRSRISEKDLQTLKYHVDAYDPANQATFIRSLGVIADKRYMRETDQSDEIRDFIYTRVGSFDTKHNIAVIDAIGNLGLAINDVGENILIDHLSATSEKTRAASIAAFSRLPQKEHYSELLLKQLDKEQDITNRGLIMSGLSRSENSHKKIKEKLLNLLPRLSVNKNRALDSLKKIDFNYDDNEIMVFEGMLRQKQNLKDQKLLAALILQHRNRKKKENK